eukprot:349990-Chlamydomonas_euryale.AAC.19
MRMVPCASGHLNADATGNASGAAGRMQLGRRPGGLLRRGPWPAGTTWGGKWRGVVDRPGVAPPPPWRAATTRRAVGRFELRVVPMRRPVREASLKAQPRRGCPRMMGRGRAG